MEEGRRNLLVGIFVLLGLTALATLVILFGRGPTWLVRGGTYPLHVQFDEVSSVRAGNLVTVKGITIGRVEDVELVPPEQRAVQGAGPSAAATRGDVLVAREAGVDVLLAIDTRYLIPKGSTAQTTEPMFGQGRPPIEILPGPSDAGPLPPGASIQGKVYRALDSILPSRMVGMVETTARQIGDAAEALTPVLDEMKEIMQRRSPREVDQFGGPQGNLSSALARLDASLKHFNDVMGDGQVKSQFRETVANVREMSEKGKKVMSDLETATGEAREVMADARKFVSKADQTLTNLDDRVNELSRSTMEGLDKADQFFDHLNLVGRQISSGEGNLGRFIMDGKLYEAMLITADRLSLAVEEFRALIAEWREGKIRVAL
jgi:ABC-type transporter Mla subunit MlaD